MLQAMDDLHVLSMLIKGTTPELMAAERERQAEVEELRVKEASKMKVQQWMQNSGNDLQSNAASRDNDFQSNAARRDNDFQSNAALRRTPENPAK